ncbi:MAG TPA: GxxExxY protein, partial [Oceanospirillales bacterium]|nr:GxxExxY protein [Oceanospirillales bacterium]
ELGCGFLEAVYHEALEQEFILAKIPYEKEKRIDIFYKGKQLESYYRVDFSCFNSVIIEIKAVNSLTGIDKAQIINYLKATKIEKGLLINFGTKSLEYKRFILN